MLRFPCLVFLDHFILSQAMMILSNMQWSQIGPLCSIQTIVVVHLIFLVKTLASTLSETLRKVIGFQHLLCSFLFSLLVWITMHELVFPYILFQEIPGTSLKDNSQVVTDAYSPCCEEPQIGFEFAYDLIRIRFQILST